MDHKLTFLRDKKMSLNQVQIIGHLGADVDLRATASGTSVATLSIATSEKWKEQDGSVKEKTEWHRVIVWGKSAENCSQYLSKGAMVFVQGKISTKKYTDKNNIERYSTEIIANKVDFLKTEKKQASNQASNYIADNNVDSQVWETPF